MLSPLSNGASGGSEMMASRVQGAQCTPAGMRIGAVGGAYPRSPRHVDARRAARFEGEVFS